MQSLELRPCEITSVFTPSCGQQAGVAVEAAICSQIQFGTLVLGISQHLPVQAMF